MVQARTLDEAYAYLELAAPPGEEALDYRLHSTLDRDGDHYVLRFDGPSDEDWFIAEVHFPAGGLGDEPDAPLSYGDGPSQLIDAGQWFVLADSYAAVAGRAAERDDPKASVAAAWSGARSAIDEVLKFLPPDAEQVPDQAFWTDMGVRARGLHPEAFSRSRLAAERERYERARAELGDLPTTGPLPAPPEEPLGLPVRTYGELYTVMDVTPCQCGSTDFPRQNWDIVQDDDAGRLIWFAGDCDNCEQTREFLFRLPAGRSGLPPVSPYLFSYPEDGPSQVLDPGQWLGVAGAYTVLCDAITEAARGQPDVFADPEDDQDMVKYLTCAAAAVDEVMKFLPRRARAVPEDACWSEDGRAQYAATPEEFGRQRLKQRQAERWQAAREFIDRETTPPRD